MQRSTRAGVRQQPAGSPSPAHEAHATLSGTRVRQLLAAGDDLPVEFTRPEVAALLREAAAQGVPA